MIASHIRALSLAAPLLLAHGLEAQAPARPAPRVSTRALQAHVAFLSDNALEGRATGSRGAAVAAHYIAAQFRRLGLEPAGDSGTYFHALPLVSRRAEP
jgi:hypothetical protein